MKPNLDRFRLPEEPADEARAIAREQAMEDRRDDDHLEAVCRANELTEQAINLQSIQNNK